MSYLVPGNDVLDPVAIRIAATGTRLVRLTPDEKLLAAALITAAGNEPMEIARRLGISPAYVTKLCQAIRRNFGADPQKF
jgi:DNA-binding CsgD family transcriptional regulator